MELNLESLGITKEDLQERVIERIAERAMLEMCIVNEEGGEALAQSELAQCLDKHIKGHIEASIRELAEKHVLPDIAAHIEAVTLQRTNEWGEAKGKAVTFTEYLVERAEAYLTEKVDWHGKTKSSGDYDWKANQTRVAHMINEHLQFSINTALTAALKTVNQQIAEGLSETVKLQLQDVVAKLKAPVVNIPK